MGEQAKFLLSSSCGFASRCTMLSPGISDCTASHVEHLLNQTSALKTRLNYCDNSTFDTMEERPPNGVTHMQRISMKKFKFQTTTDVFMQCKIRACAQQPCGICTGLGDPRQLGLDLQPVEGEMFAPPVKVMVSARDHNAMVFWDGNRLAYPHRRFWRGHVETCRIKICLANDYVCRTTAYGVTLQLRYTCVAASRGNTHYTKQTRKRPHKTDEETNTKQTRKHPLHQHKTDEDDLTTQTISPLYRTRLKNTYTLTLSVFARAKPLCLTITTTYPHRRFWRGHVETCRLDKPCHSVFFV